MVEFGQQVFKRLLGEQVSSAIALFPQGNQLKGGCGLRLSKQWRFLFYGSQRCLVSKPGAVSWFPANLTATPLCQLRGCDPGSSSTRFLCANGNFLGGFLYPSADALPSLCFPVAA